jgi:phosphatidylglycerol lysyltransferase
MAVEPLSLERDRARALILRHGWNTTAYQVLNRGFQYWFPGEQDAVVGFVGRRRVWVVGGAPSCSADRLATVCAGFESAAGRAGAAVCYVGAQGRVAERTLNDPGYSATVIGTEPWWDPASWEGTLQARASLWAQLNRARNKGVQVRLLPAAEPPGPAVEALLDRWLGSKGLPPLGFLTTPWLLDDLGDRRLFIAERGELPVGFLVLTPIPAREGWLVEQIVRAPDAPNGTAELLVDAAFRWMHRSGARFASLGLAPLAGDHPPPRPEPWWLRAGLGWLRLHGRRFYNFGGLYAFKAKLAPAGWDPVYAITNRPRVTLGALAGVAEAVVGDGLLRFGGRLAGHALRAEWRKMTKGAPSRAP